MKPFLFLVITSILVSAVAATTTYANSRHNTLDSISSLPTQIVAEDGEQLFIEEKFDDALPFFTVVCRRYDEQADIKSQKMFASAYERYGNILYKKGVYALAMDAYLQARKIEEKHHLDSLLASTYTRIGNIYASCGDYESAIGFYLKTIAMDEKRTGYTIYSMSLYNLFASNLFVGNISDAKRYLESYRNELKHKRGNFRHEFDLLLAEALLNNANGKPYKAMAYARKALQCAETHDLPPLCNGSAYSSLSASYEKTGRADSSIACLKAACRIADSIGNERLVVESLRDIARVFEAKGMRDSAMEYRVRYLNMADTISYQEEINKLKSSQMLFELDQSAFTIKNLNNEKKAQRTVTAIISMATIVCGVLLIVLLRQNKKLRNAWAALYERNSRQLLDEIKYKKTIQEYQKTIREFSEKSRPYTADSGQASENTTPTKEESQRKAILDNATRDKIASDINLFMETTDEYCSPDFNIDRLASAIGSNPRYVSEVVNIVFQKNFRALLNEYRIKQAMLRLEDTEHYGNYTIKAISESVGYKSQATFISVFTKFTGLKPSIYQKLTLERRQ